MVEPLHRVRLPVSCQCATGRILSPAVGISYRLNGRVFRTVSVGWGITLPKNAPIVDARISMDSPLTNRAPATSERPLEANFRDLFHALGCIEGYFGIISCYSPGRVISVWKHIS